jgi:YegS/Rv2252/BmrU family lipid kinase
MSVAAIINPLSGAGADPQIVERRVAFLRERFRNARIDGTVAVTDRPRHAYELAAAAAAAGVEIVIAWGGDGTVNEVGSAIAGSRSVLAVIPAGSGNGLAVAIAAPRDPDAAFAVAVHGRTRQIDAGEIDGRLFFNIAGIGFDAVIAKRFNMLPRGSRGMGPYLRIGLKQACTYRARSYRIRTNQEFFDSRALLIAFANGCEYGNKASIAPHACIDDGKLEAVIVNDRPLLARLWSVRHLAFHTAQRARGVTFRSIERAVVESDEPMDYHVDGEPGVANGQVTVRIRPNLLRVKTSA